MSNTFQHPRRRDFVIAVAAGAAVTALPARGAGRRGAGASVTEIKLGQTMPYSGPASAYGTIGRAHLAYFQMVNDQGGIHGRRVNLISLDDGYSPPKTVEQVRRLVESEQVLALFQLLGTPNNLAVHKYVNAKRVPHLFLSTGATAWGDPKAYPWTMGWNVAYQTEARIYAKYLLKHRPKAKIAVLAQNDDFGRDLLKGLKDGLGAEAARMIVAEASYETSDPTVDSQIITLQSSGADTFCNFASPKFAAQAIRKAHDTGWKPLHIVSNVSASVAGVLTPAGLDKAVGLVTIQYYKDPNDPQWKDDPAMLEWRAFMARYYREGDPRDAYNVYAWLTAQTMHHVLKQCGHDLRRENVMRQAASLKDLKLPLLLPGVTINTASDDFFPIEAAQLARFTGSQWQLFGELIQAGK